MRVTTDMFSGKPFRWNSTMVHQAEDGTRTVVPGRVGKRSSTWLHPSCVPARLLAKLNAKRG